LILDGKSGEERKKHLVNGGGLCFFKIKTGSDVFEPNEMGVPIMSNNNSDYYVELTVSPSLDFLKTQHMHCISTRI